MKENKIKSSEGERDEFICFVLPHGRETLSKIYCIQEKKKKKLLWNVMDKVGQKVGENLLMSSTWLRLYRSLRKILRSIF